MYRGMLKLTALLAAVILLFTIAGHMLGGTGGMWLLAVGALAMLGALYWFSDRLVLWMSDARALEPASLPWLVPYVQTLAQRADIPPPRLCMLDSPTSNAFACGRNPARGCLVLTSGITRLLTHDELAGVVAHEIVRIKQRDTPLAAFVAVLSCVLLPGMQTSQDVPAPGSKSIDARFVVWLRHRLLAPLVGLIVQSAALHTRDCQVDEQAAVLLGDPLPLASALEKIDWAVSQVPLHCNPGMAALYIVNPLRGSAHALRMLRVHAPTAQRVACLRALAQQGSAESQICLTRLERQNDMLWIE